MRSRALLPPARQSVLQGRQRRRALPVPAHPTALAAAVGLPSGRFVRPFRARVTLLVGCLGLFLAPSAGAVPVTHVIAPGASFSADLDIAGTWSFQTSLGSASGNLSFGGTISGNPSGQVAIDWGSPGWDGTLALSDIDIHASNLGTLSGSTSFNLFSLLPITLGIHWTFDSLSITGGSFSAPLASPPGPGPWDVSGALDDGNVVEFPSTIQVTLLGLGPSFASSPFFDFALPLLFTLERTGGFPGTGSKASMDFALPGPHALVSSTPIPVGTFSGCEVEDPLFGFCVLDVGSLSLTFAKSDLTNFSLLAEATSGVGIVPEPSTALLLGVGLAALARHRVRG